MEDKEPLRGSLRIKEAALLVGVSPSAILALWHLDVLEGEMRPTPGARGNEALWLSLDSVLAYAQRRARLERSRLALKEGRLDDVEFEGSDLLTTGEAAILVGTAPRNVSNWIAREDIDGIERTRGGNARIEFRLIPALKKIKRLKEKNRG